MASKFRLFGGPNGSGKSFIFRKLRASGTIHTEIYVNADNILRDLQERGHFNFNAYRVKSSEHEFKAHIQRSGLERQAGGTEFLGGISLIGGVLKFGVPVKDINSYHAAYISGYLVLQLFESGQSFCFETVMSHESKPELFKIAKQYGYKTYLYFIFTILPELNVVRVRQRVASGGHDVDPVKVRERYMRTFKLLPTAFSNADDAFIIDNSDRTTVLIEKQNEQINAVSKASFSERLNELVGGLLNQNP